MAARDPFGHRQREALLFGLPVGMQARAVGAFQHQQVGVAQGREGRAENRALRRDAHIAAGDDASGGRIEAEHQRAGHMARTTGVEDHIGQLGDRGRAAHRQHPHAAQGGRY